MAPSSRPCQSSRVATSRPLQRARPLRRWTFQDFGEYEVHYNALRTDTLTPEVARAYGIQRGANRVMLTVTLLRKEADQAPRKPVEGDVKVDAYNLNGQLKNIEMPSWMSSWFSFVICAPVIASVPGGSSRWMR